MNDVIVVNDDDGALGPCRDPAQTDVTQSLRYDKSYAILKVLGWKTSTTRLTVSDRAVENCILGLLYRGL